MMKVICFAAFISFVACLNPGETVIMYPTSTGWKSSAPQTGKFFRNLQAPEGRIFRSELSGDTTQKLVRSFIDGKPEKNVRSYRTTQQRVMRSPISKTVTQLPDEVTHMTRDINTHLPMVHERMRNHYTIEDVNKKRTVHHYIKPVQDVQLGMRKGRDFQQATEHLVHDKEDVSSIGNGLSDAKFGEWAGKFWKVLSQETCGQCNGVKTALVRPVCICMMPSGQQVADGDCADVPFPADTSCTAC